MDNAAFDAGKGEVAAVCRFRNLSLSGARIMRWKTKIVLVLLSTVARIACGQSSTDHRRAWETPGEIISERWFRHSRPELVAFNLDDGTSRTIVSPVTRGQGGHTVDQYSLRISHDGSLVAFFQERAIRIYRLSPSDLPLKVGQRTEKHE